jgi:hypothetical protein
VRVEADDVYVALPPVASLEATLATEIGCQLATSCEAHVHNGLLTGKTASVDPHTV